MEVDYTKTFNNYIKPAHISADEFGDKTPTLEIARIEVLKLEREKKGQPVTENAIVLFFTPATVGPDNVDRGIVLNKTNWQCLKAMFGATFQSMLGKRVTFKREMVNFGREIVPGIRIAGSPDLAQPVLEVEIKHPKKKPVTIRLTRTEVKGKPGAAPPPSQSASSQSAPPQPPADDPPRVTREPGEEG